MASKSSLGSVRLMETIRKRDLSFRKVAEELSKLGLVTQRYSVWQWAHGLSKPTLKNAFGLESWSGGYVSADSWTVADEGEMDKGREERRRRSR